MKYLLKHLEYVALSGTILVAACGGHAGTTPGVDSVAARTDAASVSGSEVVVPPSMPVDTSVGAAGVASPAGTQADAAFVSDALAANVAEIAAHKLAVSRAQNKEVRMHAQHMLTDHNKLGDGMKAYARTKSYRVPAEAPADKKAALDALSTTDKGAAWDKAYVDQQVRDHQEVINKFEAAEKVAVDPELKNLIATALPQLRSHPQMMQDVQHKLP